MKNHEFDYEEVKISNWSDLKKYLSDHFTENNWIFRGIDDEKYKLEPKIERDVDKESGGHKRDLLEMIMVENFQRKANLYLDSKHIPKKDDYLGWLSLMQHYGAPTRLLDFSKSPYIASYFAYENKFDDNSENVAIWAINYFDLIKVHEKSIYEQIEEYNKEIFRKKESIQEMTAPPKREGILFYEPFYLEQRIANQRGVFLCAHTISEINSFELNLSNALNGKNANDIVKKIILPKSIQKEVIADLRSMTIDTELIYPGLEGLVKSLKYYTIIIE